MLRRDLVRDETISSSETEPDDHRLFTINIFTDAGDASDAHTIALRVLERIEDLPGLLLSSVTISVEEPVNLTLVQSPTVQ